MLDNCSKEPPHAPLPLALWIPHPLVDALFAHADAEAPRECCGLLAGQRPNSTGAPAIVRSRYPIPNEAAEPDRFFALEGLLAPFRQMRAAGEVLLAIYHSHPCSAAVPSRRDLAENLYPETFHAIVSLAPVRELRVFRLFADGYEEVGWTTTALVDPGEPVP